MFAKILILGNLIGFAFVVSQPLFYLLAFSKAQKNLKAPSYIELRKLLDQNLQVTLRLAYYVALVTVVLLSVVAFTEHRWLLFTTSLVALAALATDIFLALKGDIPINNIINQWSPENYPRHWKLMREKWFYFFYLRQIAGITGFASLLIGAVFG